MKTLNPLKAPFGKSKFSPIRNVRYLQWEDAFEVDFDDGLSFLEPHRSIRAANKIAKAAKVKSVEVEDELRSGLFAAWVTGSFSESPLLSPRSPYSWVGPLERLAERLFHRHGSGPPDHSV